jgi:pyruvate kinase
MANELKAEVLLVFTRHGHMARHTAWMRPRYSEIYALCARDEVAASLTLSCAVTPFVVAFDMINPENTIDVALKMLAEQGRLRPGNTVVIISSILVGEQIVDAVQMRVV